MAFRVKLTLAFLGLTLLLLTGILAVVMHEMQTALEAEGRTRLSSIAAAFAAGLNARLEKAMEDGHVLRTIIQKLEVSERSDVPVLRNTLAVFVGRQPSYPLVYVVRPDGTIVASDLRHYSPRSRPVRTSLILRESLRGGSLAVAITLPIQARGAEQDTLVLEMDWSVLSNAFRAVIGGWADEPTQRWAALVDGEGTLVVSTQPDEFLPGEAFSPERSATEFWHRTVTLQHVPWTLHVFESEKTGLVAANRVLRRLAATSLLCLIGALSIAVGLARRFGWRLRLVSQAVDILQSERYEQPIPQAGSHDEIGLALEQLERLRNHIRDSHARLQEIADLRSQFVSMASHEFRTPLTTILAAADTLKQYRRQMTPGEQLERIEAIQAEVKHMTELLEDVLVFGKAESGKLQCVPRRVNLKALCDELVREVQATAAATHRLVVTSAWTRSEATMDPKLLRQILGNLLTNAVKYSPTGRTVVLQVSAQEGTRVFRVSDQGIGISAEDQRRLFEPFYRAANVGDISGSGLGLAITKTAVELHGGSIAVQSTMGVGTTFTVTLPDAKGVGE